MLIIRPAANATAVPPPPPAARHRRRRLPCLRMSGACDGGHGWNPTAGRAGETRLPIGHHLLYGRPIRRSDVGSSIELVPSARLADAGASPAPGVTTATATVRPPRPPPLSPERRPAPPLPPRHRSRRRLRRRARQRSPLPLRPPPLRRLTHRRPWRPARRLRHPLRRLPQLRQPRCRIPSARMAKSSSRPAAPPPGSRPASGWMSTSLTTRFPTTAIATTRAGSRFRPGASRKSRTRTPSAHRPPRPSPAA